MELLTLFLDCGTFDVDLSHGCRHLAPDLRSLSELTSVGQAHRSGLKPYVCKVESPLINLLLLNSSRRNDSCTTRRRPRPQLLPSATGSIMSPPVPDNTFVNDPSIFASGRSRNVRHYLRTYLNLRVDH